MMMKQTPVSLTRGTCARRQAESAHPELWDGLSPGSCFCLGAGAEFTQTDEGVVLRFNDEGSQSKNVRITED